MKHREYLKYCEVLKYANVIDYCSYLPMDILILDDMKQIHSIMDQPCEKLIKKKNLQILLNSISTVGFDHYREVIKNYRNAFIDEMSDYYLVEQHRTTIRKYTPPFLQPVTFWQLKVFASLERNLSSEICAIYLYNFSPCLTYKHYMNIITIKNGHIDITDEDGEMEYEPDNEDGTCFLIKLDILASLQS